MPKKTAPRPTATPERILPLLTSQGVEVHRNATILEVSDPLLLVELERDPRLSRFLLCRLSEQVALVDPGAAKELAQALLQAGHTPKRTTGLS